MAACSSALADGSCDFRLVGVFFWWAHFDDDATPLVDDDDEGSSLSRYTTRDGARPRAEELFKVKLVSELMNA